MIWESAPRPALISTPPSNGLCRLKQPGRTYRPEGIKYAKPEEVVEAAVAIVSDRLSLIATISDCRTEPFPRLTMIVSPTRNEDRNVVLVPVTVVRPVDTATVPGPATSPTTLNEVRICEVPVPAFVISLTTPLMESV